MQGTGRLNQALTTVHRCIGHGDGLRKEKKRKGETREDLDGLSCRRRSREAKVMTESRRDETEKASDQQLSR